MATFLDRFFKRGKKVRKFVYLGMFIQPFVKIPCWWYQDSCFNRPTATPTNCRGKAWSWHLPPTPAMMLGTQSFHLNGWLIYLMHQINYSPLFLWELLNTGIVILGMPIAQPGWWDRIGWIFFVAHLAMTRLLTGVCIQNIFNSRWFTTLENWQLSWQTVISIEMLVI